MANSIKRYPVPLIFKKILKDRMSGELSVTEDGFNKKLFFIKGNLAFASSTMVQERLGEILLTTHRINSSEFIKLSKIKEHTSRKVGEILVEITNLGRQDIYHALLYQIKSIAVSTFSICEGEWKFTKTIPKIPGNQRFKIKLPEIIKEGVDKIKDISYFKNRFYYRAPVTTTIPDLIGKFLSSDEIKFYIKLTSFSNTSVKRVISKEKIPENFFWRNIILLYLMNVIDFVEFTVDKELNRNIEEINELYNRIKASRFDYYELLRVKKTTPFDEIKESYFKFSKKYHPDRIPVAPDSTAKMKADAVFAEINRAYEILSNEDKKRKYDTIGHTINLQGNIIPKNQGKHARVLFLRANVLYKKRKYEDAGALLTNAVEIDSSKPPYYLLLGLCWAKLPQMKKMAEKNLKKAAEMEPWNSDPIFALGELYRSENFLKKAKLYFKRALELNMNHTLANKALKKIDMIHSKKKPLLSIFGKRK